METATTSVPGSPIAPPAAPRHQFLILLALAATLAVGIGLPRGTDAGGPTTPEEAVLHAPYVAVATPDSHELELLRIGETREVRRNGMWTGYKVARVVVDRTRARTPQPGEVVRVREKCDSCAELPTTATRRSNGWLILQDSVPPVREEFTVAELRYRIMPHRGQPVILFLDRAPQGAKGAAGDPEGWVHHGSRVSPTKWDPDVEARIKAAAGLP